MLGAGYENFNETNRSRFCKAVNDVLNDGRVTIEIAPKGKVWTTYGGKQVNKYNVVVKAAGWSSRNLMSGGIYTSGILRVIGQHLQIPEVREKILAWVSLHPFCERCNGVGYIPQFSYYCDGICFDCYGTGRSKYKDSVELKKEKTA